MNSKETFTDIARDPCAIIARSSCGTAVFFASYALLFLNNGNMQHGFWLSVCLGLIGCMATGKEAAIRFVLALTMVALLPINPIATAVFA